MLARPIIRAFGIVHLLMAAFGLLLCGETAFHFPQRNPWSPAQPYLAQVFWTMTTINFLFLLTLVVCGLWCLRTDRRGLRLCNLLFTLEILYWAVPPVLALYLGLALKQHAWAVGLSRSIGGAAGIGNMGLSPQILTAYPVFALIVLNVVYHRLRPAQPEP